MPSTAKGHHFVFARLDIPGILCYLGKYISGGPVAEELAWGEVVLAGADRVALGAMGGPGCAT